MTLNYATLYRNLSSRNRLALYTSNCLPRELHKCPICHSSFGPTTRLRLSYTEPVCAFVPNLLYSLLNKGKEHSEVLIIVTWTALSRIKQDRQSTYNLTFGRFPATIVTVEQQYVWHIVCVCVCVLRYTACNAHPLYCHLWPCPALPHFSTLSHKRHDFRITAIEHTMCVLISCTTTAKHFSFEEEMSEIWSKMSISLHVKLPLFDSYFNETCSFLIGFDKYSNIKFHENPSSGSRVFPCRRTDGGTDMTMLMVAFRNFANAPQSDYMRPFCIVRRHSKCDQANFQNCLNRENCARLGYYAVSSGNFLPMFRDNLLGPSSRVKYCRSWVL